MYSISITRDDVDFEIESTLEDDELSVFNLFMCMEACILASGFTDDDIELYYRTRNTENMLN